MNWGKVTLRSEPSGLSTWDELVLPNIVVTNPATGKHFSHPMRGIIDTGSAICVIPTRVAKDLQLTPVGRTVASGFGGKGTVVPFYQISLNLSTELGIVDVFAIEDNLDVVEDGMLLGRDVILAERILVVDGRNSEWKAIGLGVKVQP